MKKSVRRLLFSILVFTVIAGVVLGAFAPLLPPSSTVAQTNPQTTDIFTGQFIPAYYGAAYDPTEAYKAMAGLPVYVFAYDTWGRVINDFTYKTSVKADGSFQAAALPNASHYGVCVPTNLNPTIHPFRAPYLNDRDGLQSSFAYSIQQYPSEAPNPKDQTGKEAPFNIETAGEGEGEDGDGEEESANSCRVFLTSSRNLDISNHINLFPLVPTSLISVIIKDNMSNPDIANINKPYEIYAQRVTSKAIATTSRDGCASPEGEPGIVCEDPLTQSTLTDGPVIRGRTINYTPVTDDEEQRACGWGTIFQAFAPPGTYAITYWRPDNRNAQEQVTYLNFNGTQPLNSPYNGIAIETAKEESVPDTSTWRDNSIRCINSAEEDDTQNHWDAQYQSANIWGVIYAGEAGRLVTVDANINVSISDEKLSFVDINKRACSRGNNSGEILDTGGDATKVQSMYMFSSCNSQGDSSTGDRTASITVSSDTFDTETYRSLSVGSYKGPTSKSVGVTTSDATAGIGGTLLHNGKPVSFRHLDVIIDGVKHKDVARTDHNGHFSIGGGYFFKQPRSEVKIVLANPVQSPFMLNTFTVDVQNAPNLATEQYNLGRVALDRDLSPGAQMLASINFKSLLSLFSIEPAFAQYESPVEWPHAGNIDDDGSWAFYFNQETIRPYEKYFTRQEYHLKTIGITVPDGFSTSLREYEWTDDLDSGETNCVAWRIHEDAGYIYMRYEGDDNSAAPDGVITEGSNAGSEKIIGVALDRVANNACPDESLNWLFNIMGKDVATVPLFLKFEYEGNYYDQEGSAQGISTSTGQDNQDAPPKILEIKWPVTLTRVNDSRVKVDYEPIALKVGVEDCGGFKITDIFNMGEAIKSFACSIVVGSLNMVETFFTKIAAEFFIIQPLDFEIVTTFWNIVRNLINALSILFLILAGVAIMFRYDSNVFNIKTALTRLIVVIVLVNFSILIIQIAIDVANVMAFGGFHFLIQALSGDLNTATGAGVTAAAAGVGTLGAYVVMIAMGAGGGIPGVLALLLFIFAVVLLFGYVALRIIVDYGIRLAVLWLCIIFAPVAIAARILPSTQPYFKKWKDILVGALVAQIAFAMILAVAIGVLKQSVQSPMFQDAFISFVMALILFFFSTKVPSKVAAAVGTDMSSSLESLGKKGLLQARTATGNYLKVRERGKIDKAAAEQRGENFRASKYKWTNAKLRGISESLDRAVSGVSTEDLDKERESRVAENARKFRRDEERRLQKKGLLRAEVEGKFSEEKEGLEYRMLEAKGGVSKGKFERNRDLTNTGHNVDYSVGGKVDIGGAAWRGEFISDKNKFFTDLGGNRAGSVAQNFLESINDVGGHINDEDSFNRALDQLNNKYGGGANYEGLMGALKAEGITFNELQGTKGMKGYMLTGVLNSASKVDSTLDTDYGAIRNQLGRNQYDPNNYMPPTTHAPQAAEPPFNAAPATDFDDATHNQVEQWMEDVRVLGPMHGRTREQDEKLLRALRGLYGKGYRGWTP